MIIVYKTLTMSACWVQVRQITCGYCNDEFVYLATGNESVRTTGLPVVSGTDAMRASARTDLTKRLSRLGNSPRKGEARCPHCQRYQRWMVMSSRLRRVWQGIVWGPIVGILATIVVGRFFFHDSSSPFAVAALTIAGFPGGVCWAILGGLPTGASQEGADRRSMTPEDYREFAQACRRKDADPALTWFRNIGGKVQRSTVVVPLPFYFLPSPMEPSLGEGSTGNARRPASACSMVHGAGERNKS
jgi:hypothetical protein